MTEEALGLALGSWATARGARLANKAQQYSRGIMERQDNTGHDLAQMFSTNTRELSRFHEQRLEIEIVCDAHPN
jgi:hypothetical protein